MTTSGIIGGTTSNIPIAPYSPTVTAGVLIASFGDSITAQNYGLYSSSTAIAEECTGTGVGSINAYYGQPFLHPVRQDYGNTAGDDTTRIGYNKGVSGNTTTQMVARLTDITNLDPAPDMVFFMGGTNDLKADVANSTIQGNIETIANAVFDIGATLVLYTVTPRNAVDGAGDWDNTTQRDNLLLLNEWIISKSQEWISQNKKVILVNPFIYWNDGSNNAKTGYTKDGLHPSNLGVQAGIIPALRAAFDKYGLFDHSREYNSAAFDASTAPYGNQIPLMNSGTGGTVTAPATGDVMTDFRVSNNGTAGNLSYACSVIDSPLGDGNKWQRIDITSDGGGTAGEVEQCLLRPQNVQNFNGITGEWYVMSATIYIYSGGDEILNTAYAFLDDRADGRDIYGGLADLDSPSFNLNRPIIRTLKTPFLQAGSTGGDWRPEIRINCFEDVAGTVSIAIGNWTFERLENAPDFG